LAKNGQGEASGPLVRLVDERRTLLVYREACTEGKWMTFGSTQKPNRGANWQ